MYFTVSDIKRGKLKNRPSIPKEGTYVRELYDEFINEKRVIAPPRPAYKAKQYNKFYTSIQNLITRYGLDIRPQGDRIYICFGTEHEDFCLQNIEELRHIT